MKYFQKIVIAKIDMTFKKALRSRAPAGGPGGAMPPPLLLLNMFVH